MKKVELVLIVSLIFTQQLFTQSVCPDAIGPWGYGAYYQSDKLFVDFPGPSNLTSSAYQYPPLQNLQISGFVTGTFDTIFTSWSSHEHYDISPNTFLNDPLYGNPLMDGQLTFTDGTTCDFINGYLDAPYECPESISCDTCDLRLYFPMRHNSVPPAGPYDFDFGLNHSLNGTYSGIVEPYYSHGYIVRFANFCSALPNCNTNPSYIGVPPVTVTFDNKACGFDGLWLQNQSFVSNGPYDCPHTIIPNLTNEFIMVFDQNANIPSIGYDNIEVSTGLSSNSGPYSPKGTSPLLYELNPLISLTGSISFLDNSTQSPHLTCNFENGNLVNWECPVKMECWNNQLLLWFDKRQGINPFDREGSYSLYFGPNQYGVYSGIVPPGGTFIPPSPNHDYILIGNSYSCLYPDGPPYVDIKFDKDGQGGPPEFECILTSDCSEVLADCGDQLVSYIDGQVSECKQWDGACNPDYSIFRGGNIGIGTSALKAGYQLTVKGKITTERFKVNNNGNWCDYVFKDDYDLLSLNEVRKEINNTGHLHNMLSEEEIVESGGYELGDMKLNQQEKIEEIFLHLIDLDKRANKLSSKK